MIAAPTNPPEKAAPVTRVFHAHSTPNPDEGGWQALPQRLNAVGQLAVQSARTSAHPNLRKPPKNSTTLVSTPTHTNSASVVARAWTTQRGARRSRTNPTVRPALRHATQARNSGTQLRHAIQARNSGTQFRQLVAMDLYSHRYGSQLDVPMLPDPGRLIY